MQCRPQALCRALALAAVEEGSRLRALATRVARLCMRTAQFPAAFAAARLAASQQGGAAGEVAAALCVQAQAQLAQQRAAPAVTTYERALWVDPTSGEARHALAALVASHRGAPAAELAVVAKSVGGARGTPAGGAQPQGVLEEGCAGGCIGTRRSPLTRCDSVALSASIVWRLQLQAYHDLCLDAWRLREQQAPAMSAVGGKTVPFNITSNARIATAYARCVHAWLLELSHSVRACRRSRLPPPRR